MFKEQSTQSVAQRNINPEPPAPKAKPEQRSDFRVTLVMRTAKIVFDDLEALCLVRDASASGVRLQFFYPIPVADKYQLELDNGVRYPLELAWTTGNFAGFRSHVEIDLKGLIGGQKAQLAARQIRLQTAIQGIIQAGYTKAPIKFENISQQGACITCPIHLAIDQIVKIETKLLPNIFGKIRWRRRPFYGVIFEDVFQFTELATLLSPNTAKSSNTAT